MSNDPGIDPYATPMSADLEPQKEPLDRRAEGHPSRNVPPTFLGRTMAFLNSPRIAMRAVVDTAPVWTILPLAAVWGMVHATARAVPMILSEPTPRDVVVRLGIHLAAGLVVGILSCLYFAFFVSVTASLFSVPLRFREASLIVGWSAVPHLAMVPVTAVYFGLEASGVLGGGDSAAGLLVEMFVGLLGMALTVCCVAFCITGMSEATGRSVARSGGWFAVSFVLSFFVLLVTIVVVLRSLS